MTDGEAQKATSFVKEGALDLSRLREMVGDDDDLIQDLLRSFLESSLLNLEALATAITSGDAPAARMAAHSLKGAAGNFGAETLRCAAAELEHRAQDGSLEGAGEMLAKIRQAFAAVEIGVRNCLPCGAN